LRFWGLLVGAFALAVSLSGRFSESTQGILFGSLCIGSVVLFLCWFISIPLMQVTAIHPAAATEYRLTLKRVAPAFVEAVHQHREDRQGQTQPEDYREHFRPRRSPPHHGERDDERIERS
jgi:hypothetical protein